MKIVDSEQDIIDMARGAAFLGTGGGGDPYIGQLFVRSQMKRGRMAKIADPSEVADDAFIISIFAIGAPPPFLEQLVSEKLLTNVLTRFEAIAGRRIDALICAEIGGFNSMMPLAISAMTGLPAVDADGIGRAVPHMEMTTFSILGLKASPVLLMDEFGNEAVINTVDDATCEIMVRQICGALGASVIGAGYPMTGQQMKQCAVLHTVTETLEIGRCIRRERENGEDLFAALLVHLNRDGRFARVLFDGKIIDVTHEIRDGWHWGRATIRGLANPDDVLTVDLQNEYTVARLNGKTVTIVPDLIAILDRESGEPLTAESLSYGQRVKVIGCGADPILRRPESLKVLGPRRHGIDEDFRPLEELVPA